ncbi:MAG: DUF1289 domain-containing protein, partial [Rhodobacteraceae bacterium]|nr:DUF1289 domain-containing protein [Paracoccaceae bacterium]
GICKLDEATGWCLGCGRTGEEMDGWRVQSEQARQEVWEQIPVRLKELGVTCRRLPWTTDDVRAFVTSTLEAGRGTWVIGFVGAVAEFTAAQGDKVEVHVDGDDITAYTQNGALRVKINDDIRALTFDPPDWGREPRIVLAVKRERGRLSMVSGVADLGPDTDALVQEQNAKLYDLGLGRKEGRFCVRLAEGAAREALNGSTGLTFPQALPMIAGPLVAESPTRVVESALGRIEVQGQIPPPDAKSPDGPHTHLLPDHLETGRALPVGMDLPRAYLPGAIFYPPK